jgi:hypothetical protein
MPIIQRTHDLVFNWLFEWSKRARQENLFNPFFYLRTLEDERFKQGYWFPGNDQYVCISFWTGGDSLNRTPNIYLEFHATKGINLKLIARDSVNKEKYFEKLAQILGGFKEGKTKGVFTKEVLYTKQVSKNTINYLSYLSDFVNNEKVIIDNFLKLTLENTDSPDYQLLKDEYAAPTGFIKQGQFDLLVIMVLKQRASFAPTNVRVEIILEENNKNIHKEELIFLKRFEFSNYKGIIDCKISEIQSFCNWIFITGENGFGKTCLLQALALGLTNYPENFTYYSSNDNSLQKVVPDIGVTFNFKNEIPNHTNFLSTVDLPDFKSLNDFFIGYGVSRLEPQNEQVENITSSNSSNIFTLFETGGFLKNFNYELKKYYHSAPERFKVLKTLISDVTNGRIADIVVNDFDLKYIENVVDGNLPAVHFEDLATGYRNIINIVGDIYIRFTESQKTINHQNLIGIVCIDELENHLHVKYQKELPSLLSKIFPKIQFIATTHSPIPLLGALENTILIKVDRTNEEGITANIVTIDNAIYLNPNIILTSPIFGLKEIFNNRVKEYQNLRTEDSWEEMKKNDTLDSTLLKIYKDRNSKLDEKF